MIPVSAPKKAPTSSLLSDTEMAILVAIYQFLYMTALDVLHLLGFSASSLSHVREVLRRLAGNADYATRAYLFRFPVPSVKKGTRVYAYILGAKGRRLLAVEGYYRPYKHRSLSYSHIWHALCLTRFCVAAAVFCRSHPSFTLADTRLSYALSGNPPHVTRVTNGAESTVAVIPDAWLLFVRDGTEFPLMLEVDRGTSGSHKVTAALRARIELITSGGYRRHFGTDAVRIAYLIVGLNHQFARSRAKALCSLMMQVLTAMRLQDWAGVFRVAACVYDELYNPALFTDALWYRPDSPVSVLLFDPITADHSPADSAGQGDN